MRPSDLSTSSMMDECGSELDKYVDQKNQVNDTVEHKDTNIVSPSWRETDLDWNKETVPDSTNHNE